MANSLDPARKSVLVLGASGFIGSRLVAALSRDPAYYPIAASRRLGAGPKAAGAFDATNIEAMRSALRNADYVVNCIAGSSRTMVAATDALCNAARTSPPLRIIHLSSMAVYGAATGTVREDHSPTAPLSGYGAAKIACERSVMKYVDDGGDAVILRPTCVFGPGSAQWTTRLGNLLVARRIGDLGRAGDGRCNIAFIDDLVASIICALTAPNASGKAFNISNSMTSTWNQFLIRFAKALGATPVRRIPQWRLKLESKLLAPARRIAEIGLRRVGIRSTLTEAITPSLLSLMGQDIHIDCSAAAEQLLVPRASADQMIASAVEWLQNGALSISAPRGQMEPASS
jgi:2-alkyl-3-oxoalkanoate reductase